MRLPRFQRDAPANEQAYEEAHAAADAQAQAALNLLYQREREKELHNHRLCGNLNLKLG